MAASGSKERLTIHFDSPDRLRDEFEKNISNGGIFVPSQGEFAIRERVVVEIRLDYLDTANDSLSLEGEVVHCIPAEMAPAGATPGVAVQFDVSAQELRARFEPLLGEAVQVPQTERGDDDESVVRAKRRPVRVPIRVMPVSCPPFEATSRDLSATGILISMGEQPLPKGEEARICLWHPSGEKSVEIDGVVVREVRNKSGRIAAVAVAFDRDQAADPRVVEIIEVLIQAGHRSQLGGISGSIADLGLANLLQMFGASVPRGTVVCSYDGEQGWIAFADGDLLAAEVGSLEGHEAMVAMLDWPEGRFNFEAVADEKLLAAPNRRSLDASILDAVCAIDERDAAAGDDDDSIANMAPQPLALTSSSVFTVNEEFEVSARVLLGDTEEAALDLAKSGLSMDKILDRLPEDEAVVRRAIEELVDSGVLRLR